MQDVMSLLYLAPFVVVGALLAVWLFLCIKNIRSTEIGIVEQRYIGKKLPTGRAYALPGEIGIQVRYLDPGFRFLLWPFQRLVKRQPFLVINENQIGIVTATDGKQLASDRIFADDEAGDKHDNFQNPIGFFEAEGVRGKQLRFLTNGTWKIHPFLFHVQMVNKTVVPDGKVGLVTAEDGASLEPGQFLAKSVTGHDSFQRPERFLRQGGQKGPQIDIIRPGTYNIHTDMFKVQVVPAVAIDKEHVGVVEANAGLPLSKGDVVAATPDMPTHNAFQDGQKFLDSGGIRGPQESVLAPGTYYINTFLFDVKTAPQTVIKQGEAGILISNLGKDPAGLEDDQPPFPGASDDIAHNSEDPEESRLNKGVRQRHVVPEGYRGIQKNVLGPGKYNINPLAYSVVIIPTTTRSIAWTAEKTDEEDRYFNPFAVVSHDGFEMRIEIGCQYRILPENAPYVVQKLGSIAELEANVLHPQIDGIVRAQVSKSIAIKYQQNRAEEQTAAEEAVRADLAKYRVDIVSVMIRNIVLPDELMKTTQQKNLANLEESMWDAKKEAETRRIEFERTKAEADQQAPLMKAQVGIQIADHEAKQKEKRAQGTAAQIRIEAEAEAGKIKQVGDAEAGVIKTKGEATGDAYDRQVAALTAEGVSAIEIITRIAAANLRITPDVLVSGGNGGGDGNGLVQLLLANLVKQSLDGGKTITAPATVVATEPAADAAPQDDSEGADASKK
ncbi:MAG: SPFH domain-containing protein [Candidatus Obscuribacterales bacterium]